MGPSFALLIQIASTRPVRACPSSIPSLHFAEDWQPTFRQKGAPDSRASRGRMKPWTWFERLTSRVAAPKHRIRRLRDLMTTWLLILLAANTATLVGMYVVYRRV